MSRRTGETIVDATGGCTETRCDDVYDLRNWDDFDDVQ